MPDFINYDTYHQLLNLSEDYYKAAFKTNNLKTRYECFQIARAYNALAEKMYKLLKILKIKEEQKNA